ncbi:MAG: hypothetical protein JWQ76_5877 [Ramlibacter sp.]|jgi:hypothetical protein|nr:hypothetical protein [Ramlibacter sp.]MDX6714018.1 hypothetical protein [Baekduia sp.]
MTRVTFGMYRKGVREPGTTMSSAAAANAGFQPPTPTPIAQSAIVRHHRESPAAARAQLHRSFRNSDYWGPNGTPQTRGWARVIRELYDVYDGLTQGDPRIAFAYGVERDIPLGVDVLGVRADVVLLDAAGYVPRLVLWDKNDLTYGRAIEYGAPVWRAMEDELGDGRVAAVEVWALRGPTQITVTPAQANVAMGQVARTVHRLAQ